MTTRMAGLLLLLASVIVARNARAQPAPMPTSPPPVTAADDTLPATPAASTNIGGITVVTDAGVGSGKPYAHAGVVELGGSMGFSQAGDFTQFALNPTFGLFLIQNLELSAMLGLNVVNSSGMTTWLMSGLIEPSYHIPIDNWFALVGVGFGFVSARGAGTGLALVPRVGANFPIGRSGILTPSMTLAYYTASDVETSSGSVTTVNTSWGLNVGYTVMW